MFRLVRKRAVEIFETVLADGCADHVSGRRLTEELQKARRVAIERANECNRRVDDPERHMHDPLPLAEHTGG